MKVSHQFDISQLEYLSSSVCIREANNRQSNVLFCRMLEVPVVHGRRGRGSVRGARGGPRGRGRRLLCGTLPRYGHVPGSQLPRD